MVLEKLSSFVLAQVSLANPKKVVSVYLWLDESKKDTLDKYGIAHPVPGFLVLATVNVAILDILTHEDWLMLVTQGQNDSRTEAAVS